MIGPERPRLSRHLEPSSEIFYGSRSPAMLGSREPDLTAAYHVSNRGLKGNVIYCQFIESVINSFYFLRPEIGGGVG